MWLLATNVKCEVVALAITDFGESRYFIRRVPGHLSNGALFQPAFHLRLTGAVQRVQKTRFREIESLAAGDAFGV